MTACFFVFICFDFILFKRKRTVDNCGSFLYTFIGQSVKALNQTSRKQKEKGNRNDDC